MVTRMFLAQNHDEDCKWGGSAKCAHVYTLPSSMKQATLITHTTSIINCDHNNITHKFHRTFHVPIYPCDTQCSEGVDKLDREEIDDSEIIWASGYGPAC